MSNKAFWTVLSIALLGLAPIHAAEPSLGVGDPAPPLQVGKWIQGEPVKAFDRDHAYIVEFWATWCGPCVQTIPHLNEIHKKFKDKGLIVVGQDVWERNEEEVPKFVKKMGEKMTYRVALDDKEGSARGKMADTWMTAAGKNGIPTAFVINKEGKIAWIGHPAALKESLIESVIAGTYDLEKAIASERLAREYEERTSGLRQQFSQAMQAKEYDKAESILNDIEKAAPEENRTQVRFIRFRVQMEKKDYDAAYKLARELSESEPKNASMHNELAWAIVSDSNIEKPDLELTAKLAEQANKLTDGKDAAILDTLARVQFMKGDKEQAIQTQEKAVSLAEGGMKTRFEKVLKSYKEGKLPELD